MKSSGVRTAGARKFYDMEQGPMEQDPLEQNPPGEGLSDKPAPNVTPSVVSRPPKSIIIGSVRPAVSPPTKQGNRVYSSHACQVDGVQMTVNIITRFTSGGSPSLPVVPQCSGMVVLPVASGGSPLYCGLLCHNMTKGGGLIYGIVFPTYTEGPVIVMCGCPAQYSDLRRLARLRVSLDFSKIVVHGRMPIPAWPGELRFGNYNSGNLHELAQPMICEMGTLSELTLAQDSICGMPSVAVHLRMLSYPDGSWQPLEVMATVAAPPNVMGCPMLPRVVQFFSDSLVDYHSWCIGQGAPRQDAGKVPVSDR